MDTEPCRACVAFSCARSEGAMRTTARHSRAACCIAVSVHQAARSGCSSLRVSLWGWYSCCHPPQSVAHSCVLAGQESVATPMEEPGICQLPCAPSVGLPDGRGRQLCHPCLPFPTSLMPPFYTGASAAGTVRAYPILLLQPSDRVDPHLVIYQLNAGAFAAGTARARPIPTSWRGPCGQTTRCCRPRLQRWMQRAALAVHPPRSMPLALLCRSTGGLRGAPLAGESGVPAGLAY